MNYLTTDAIILKRTDYGEADRILTVLAPDYGKIRLIAKGVRKVNSKLSGGIELFSVSTITCVRGRSDLSTLISTRLLKHYVHIVQDLTKVQLGYELIKLLDKATEDELENESAYFKLINQAFQLLDIEDFDINLVRAWYYAQLLKLNGHSPN